MKLSNQGSVPVYTISGSSTARPLPEWLARKRRRSLKQDPDYANRIELLQDFEFEEASSCIRASDDGDWVVSTGKATAPDSARTYKPQIHVHYLPHLSLSYARHTNAENKTFILLSSDYSKQLHLQQDRSLELHTPQGCHYTTRIPRYGRDLLYDKRSAEALIPSVGLGEEGLGEVYRLNLEVGRFMRPYSVDIGGDEDASAIQGGIDTGSVNTAAIAEDSHNLLAFGTSLGTVEFWDPRSRARVGLLPAPSSFSETLLPGDAPTRAEITALKYHHNGLTLATGSSNGLIHLYDLRSPTPLLKKDQGYGYPIHTLTFLDTPRTHASTAYTSTSETPKILSADKRIIKIWDSSTGAPWTHVEAAVDLHNVEWCRDTGMLLTSNEGRQQHSFFIPSLGPAPRWCSFLDNLVEEMAEDAEDPNAYQGGAAGHRTGEVYDNYKFVTPKQLATLGLENKVGTGLLKPYMHGYFMRQELYEEARILAQPEVWAERRQQSIRERIEKERESRIRGTKKAVGAKVNVNKELAQRMVEREEANERRKAKRELRKREEAGEDVDGETDVDGEMDVDGDDNVEEPKTAKERETLLTDPRFASLFKDEDFAIDQSTHEFRQLNPSTRADATSGEGRKCTAVEEEEDELANRRGRRGSSSSGEESDDEDASEDDTRQQPRRHANSASAADRGKISSASYRKSGHVPLEKRHPPKERGPQMRASTSGHRPSLQSQEKSFGSRMKSVRERPANDRHKAGGSGNVVGEREMTFVPRSKGRQRDEESGYANEQRSHSRRGKDRRSASMNTFRRQK